MNNIHDQGVGLPGVLNGDPALFESLFLFNRQFNLSTLFQMLYDGLNLHF